MLQVRLFGAGSEVTDEDLIAKAGAGDKESFEILWTRHEATVEGIIFPLLRDKSDREDAKQIVAIQLFRKIHTYKGKSDYKTWLYRVVYNCAMMHARASKSWRYQYLEDTLLTRGEQAYLIEPDNVDGMHLRSDKEIIAAIKEAMDAVGPESMEAAALFLIAEMEFLEVASKLSISIPCVKSRVHRARLSLRKKLLCKLGHAGLRDLMPRWEKCA
jgi:RNA polymerase sigma-70 factor (ECF subfamily)